MKLEVTAPRSFTGRVWKFEEEINTDLVIPNFAVLMPVEEQLRHCFSANRPGWVDEVRPGDAVAVSPTATALVAERARLVELPPDPVDLTVERVASVAAAVDVVLLDTAEVAGPDGDPVWTAARRRRVLRRFAARGFRPTFEAEDVFVLERRG